MCHKKSESPFSVHPGIRLKVMSLPCGLLFRRHGLQFKAEQGGNLIAHAFPLASLELLLGGVFQLVHLVAQPVVALLYGPRRGQAPSRQMGGEHLPVVLGPAVDVDPEEPADAGQETHDKLSEPLGGNLQLLHDSAEYAANAAVADLIQQPRNLRPSAAPRLWLQPQLLLSAAKQIFVDKRRIENLFEVCIRQGNKFFKFRI